MSISSLQLLRIMPHAKHRIDTFLDALNAAMQEFEVDNGLRESAFLAQVAHESGELRYTREIASGAAYEGRLDLGNTEPGDGIRFPGRGLFELTGRDNYLKCGNALGVDFISNPERLEQPEYAARSAGWFWQSRGLNELADKQMFLNITKRINGGTNGYQQRCEFYDRALQVIGVS